MAVLSPIEGTIWEEMIPYILFLFLILYMFFILLFGTGAITGAFLRDQSKSKIMITFVGLIGYKLPFYLNCKDSIHLVLKLFSSGLIVGALVGNQKLIVDAIKSLTVRVLSEMNILFRAEASRHSQFHEQSRPLLNPETVIGYSKYNKGLTSRKAKGELRKQKEFEKFLFCIYNKGILGSNGNICKSILDEEFYHYLILNRITLIRREQLQNLLKSNIFCVSAKNKSDCFIIDMDKLKYAIQNSEKNEQSRPLLNPETDIGYSKYNKGLTSKKAKGKLRKQKEFEKFLFYIYNKGILGSNGNICKSILDEEFYQYLILNRITLIRREQLQKLLKSNIFCVSAKNKSDCFIIDMDKLKYAIQNSEKSKVPHYQDENPF